MLAVINFCNLTNGLTVMAKIFRHREVNDKIYLYSKQLSCRNLTLFKIQKAHLSIISQWADCTLTVVETVTNSINPFLITCMGTVILHI